MNPKISVIVPVYKAEKYLHRCVDSILAQTFTDFEVLLIDDGSPDRSGEICDEYAQKDTRVRVFHKENGGVSSARNLGLDNARGEWISFIDADDYLSQGFFDIQGNEDADIIQKSYTIVQEENGKQETRNVIAGSFNNKEDFYRFFVRKRTNALWDKIIRRKLIGDTRFNVNVHIGEDFLFFLSLLKNIKCYDFNEKGNYYYLIRSGSAMQKINKNLRERGKIMIENINNIRAILNDKSEEMLFYGIIYQSYINTLYGYRKVLTPESLKIVKEYYERMTLAKLKFVSNSFKVRLLIKKLLIKF